MAQISFIEMFKSARRVSTPLMAVRTPDPSATMATVLDAYNNVQDIPPMLCWDIVRGLLGLNDNGHKAAATLLDNQDGVTLASPIEVLIKAMALPRRSILFLFRALNI